MYNVAQRFLATLESTLEQQRDGSSTGVLSWDAHTNPRTLRKDIGRLLQKDSGFLSACPLTPAEHDEFSLACETVVDATYPGNEPLAGLIERCQQSLERLSSLAFEYQAQQKERWLAHRAYRAEVAKLSQQTAWACAEAALAAELVHQLRREPDSKGAARRSDPATKDHEARKDEAQRGAKSSAVGSKAARRRQKPEEATADDGPKAGGARAPGCAAVTDQRAGSLTERAGNGAAAEAAGAAGKEWRTAPGFAETGELRRGAAEGSRAPLTAEACDVARGTDRGQPQFDEVMLAVQRARAQAQQAQACAQAALHLSSTGESEWGV